MHDQIVSERLSRILGGNANKIDTARSNLMPHPAHVVFGARLMAVYTMWNST